MVIIKAIKIWKKLEHCKWLYNLKNRNDDKVRQINTFIIFIRRQRYVVFYDDGWASNDELPVDVRATIAAACNRRIQTR